MRPTVGSLRERNRQRTRAEIAEAALALFEQHGYEATTVEQVAAAAGVSSATFFRYFATKEDVLFADEDAAAAALVDEIARRSDPAMTVPALAVPVAAYAASLADGAVPRLTRLVMTTRTLEARSLRMRLRWEQDVARQLAHEQHAGPPALAHTLVAAVAVSCLTSALRHWAGGAGPELPRLVTEAFDIVN